MQLFNVDAKARMAKYLMVLLITTTFQRWILRRPKNLVDPTKSHPIANRKLCVGTASWCVYLELRNKCSS